MPSQAQINHFLANPEQFIRGNSLVWRGPAPDDQDIIDVAMLDVAGAARIRTGSRFFGRGNAKANVSKFELRWRDNPHYQLDPGTPTFQVHWSGYKAGQGRDAHLPGVGGPNIMLTPEFTGCTAVCRTNADGSGQFSHYNLMAGAQTLEDADMRAIANAAYGGGHSTMTKDDVRAHGKHSDAVKATVVGVRRNGSWEFWAQIREGGKVIRNAAGDNATGPEQIRAVVRL